MNGTPIFKVSQAVCPIGIVRFKSHIMSRRAHEALHDIACECVDEAPTRHGGDSGWLVILSLVVLLLFMPCSDISMCLKYEHVGMQAK